MYLPFRPPLLATVLFAGSFSLSQAQVEIGSGEDGGLVIEVNEKTSRNDEKSLLGAMALSAALPGTGELYLGEQGWAKGFLLAEAGFWAALFFSFQARESYLQSARYFASAYAGAHSQGKDEVFLERMGSYRSYQEKDHRQDSYESAQILNGEQDQDGYDLPPEESNYWDFGSSNTPANTRAWRRYQSSLRYYRGAKVAVSFAVGALVLDRVASLVNTLHLYRTTTTHGLSWNVQPYYDGQQGGAAVSLRF